MLINVSIKIVKQFSQSVQEIEFERSDLKANRTIFSELRANSSLLNKLLSPRSSKSLLN